MMQNAESRHVEINVCTWWDTSQFQTEVNQAAETDPLLWRCIFKANFCVAEVFLFWN